MKDIYDSALMMRLLVQREQYLPQALKSQARYNFRLLGYAGADGGDVFLKTCSTDGGLAGSRGFSCRVTCSVGDACASRASTSQDRHLHQAQPHSCQKQQHRWTHAASSLPESCLETSRSNAA